MQVLKAGDRQIISLELEPELVTKIARQVGFACEVSDNKRGLLAVLRMEGRETPLLLFDAAEPANLGWFSRCQFYVDGRTGAVMQTPMNVANRKDRSGRPQTGSIRLLISKELPINFRLPGNQPMTENVFYPLLFNFLYALTRTGVVALLSR